MAWECDIESGTKEGIFWIPEEGKTKKEQLPEFLAYLEENKIDHLHILIGIKPEEEKSQAIVFGDISLQAHFGLVKKILPQIQEDMAKSAIIRGIEEIWRREAPKGCCEEDE